MSESFTYSQTLPTSSCCICCCRCPISLSFSLNALTIFSFSILTLTSCPYGPPSIWALTASSCCSSSSAEGRRAGVLRRHWCTSCTRGCCSGSCLCSSWMNSLRRSTSDRAKRWSGFWGSSYGQGRRVPGNTWKGHWLIECEFILLTIAGIVTHAHIN